MLNNRRRRIEYKGYEIEEARGLKQKLSKKHMSRKPTYGVWVRETQKPCRVIIPARNNQPEEISEWTEHKFELFYGKHDPKRRHAGEIFITNPQAHEVIKAHSEAITKPASEKLGSTTALVYTNAQKIVGVDHYPFGTDANCLDLDELAPRQFREKLRKIGLATLLELQIGKALKKRYPNYSVAPSYDEQAPRIRQLQQRGQNPRATIPLETALKLSKNYLIEKAKARRKKDKK